MPAMPADTDPLSLLPRGNTGPTSSMMPATSCPGTRGYWMPGHLPSVTSTSLWQMPQACYLDANLPGARLGNLALDDLEIAPPGLEICATFIVATAMFVVAIIAPANSRFPCRSGLPPRK